MNWTRGWLKVFQTECPQFHRHSIVRFRDGETDEHEFVVHDYEVELLHGHPAIPIEITSDHKWLRWAQRDGTWLYFPAPDFRVYILSKKGEK